MKNEKKYANRRGVPVSRFCSKFRHRERLGLDIFQNGGIVENLIIKSGRKNCSFLAILEAIFVFLSGNAFMCYDISIWRPLLADLTQLTAKLKLRS